MIKNGWTAACAASLVVLGVALLLAAATPNSGEVSLWQPLDADLVRGGYTCEQTRSPYDYFCNPDLKGCAGVKCPGPTACPQKTAKLTNATGWNDDCNTLENTAGKMTCSSGDRWCRVDQTCGKCEQQTVDPWEWRCTGAGGTPDEKSKQTHYYASGAACP
jgi:hypothetical protein